LAVDLYKHIGALDAFSDALILISEDMPKRMTASQLVFFLATASADLKGHSPTYSSIKGSIGESLARSLHTTYGILLEKCSAHPNGLGLLRREINPDDNREYFLHLTPKGRRLIRKLALQLAGAR
jgi:hypothetical protein